MEVNLKDENVWLTQAQMAELFGKARNTITEHIRNIFKEGELEENSNVGFPTLQINTLVALTLLIAELNPKEKEVIVDWVMNFLND